MRGRLRGKTLGGRVAHGGGLRAAPVGGGEDARGRGGFARRGERVGRVLGGGVRLRVWVEQARDARGARAEEPGALAQGSPRTLRDEGVLLLQLTRRLSRGGEVQLVRARRANRGLADGGVGAEQRRVALRQILKPAHNDLARARPGLEAHDAFLRRSIRPRTGGAHFAGKPPSRAPGRQREGYGHELLPRGKAC